MGWSCSLPIQKMPDLCVSACCALMDMEIKKGAFGCSLFGYSRISAV
jgi:hypothetical protein